MTRISAILFFAAFLATPAVSWAETPASGELRLPENLTATFGDFEGCFVIKQVGAARTAAVFNDEDCHLQTRPCSTFKILHTLIGLETGVLSGPDHKIPWDGTKRPVKIWERDHTLATAIRYSVVPYFQQVARHIGPQRMELFLRKVDYGNAAVGPIIDRFWLVGPLKISAFEQIDFLERLYTDDLPFPAEHMRTVRALIVLEKLEGGILSGKTGSALDAGKPTLGWFVGHVGKAEAGYVFATRISAPDGATGKAARRITREILGEMALLP